MMASLPLQENTHPAHEAIEASRKEYYNFLAMLFSASPTQQQLDFLAGLETTIEKNALTAPLLRIIRTAQKSSEKEIKTEYDALFIGLSRGEVLPYASYYLTGFLYEKPLASIRGDMAQLALQKNKVCLEPEDHIALLCATMARLCTRSLKEQAIFFMQHIHPWISRFLNDLKQAPSALFYKNVAELGLKFMEIEYKAFEIVHQ